jgi:hypothetical protein
MWQAGSTQYNVNYSPPFSAAAVSGWCSTYCYLKPEEDLGVSSNRHKPMVGYRLVQQSVTVLPQHILETIEEPDTVTRRSVWRKTTWPVLVVRFSPLAWSPSEQSYSDQREEKPDRWHSETCNEVWDGVEREVKWWYKCVRTDFGDGGDA